MRRSSPRRTRTPNINFAYDSLEPRQLLASVSVGNLNSGVAVADDATGEGYILFSHEDVHSRFSNISENNADHFFAARLIGNQWQYNDDVNWVDFDLRTDDQKIAEAFFGSDRVAPLTTPGSNSETDVWVVPNFFGGDEDVGEFQIFGSTLEVPDEDPNTTLAQRNLSALAQATLVFESVNQHLPQLATFNANGEALLSWRVQLLPYLGYDDLYDQFNLDEAWNSAHNLSLLDQMPTEFSSSNLFSNTRTLFQAIGGDDTAFTLDGSDVRLRDIDDGLQSTLLYVEADPNRAVQWTRPVDLYFNEADPTFGLGNASPAGINAVSVSGESLLLPTNIPSDPLSNLINRNDGNAVDLREFANVPDASQNLRNLTLSLLNYESAFQQFPNQAIYAADNVTPLLSWRVSLLPFLGHQNLYDQFRLDEAWNSPHNASLISQMPIEFAHEDVADGLTNFLGVAGPDTLFEIGPNANVSLNQLVDGLQNTLAIVAADADQAVVWTRPADFTFDAADPSAGLGELDGSSFQASFVEGFVATISNSVSDANLNNLFQRNDRNVVDFSEIDRTISAQVNLRRIALSFLNHESALGEFPTQAITAPDGTPLLSWRVAILPFLGEQNLYDQFNLDEAWDSPNNIELVSLIPSVFEKAGIPTGFTPYLGSVGEDTLFRPDQLNVSFGSIFDGAQNTILVVEANDDRAVEWTRPVDLEFDPVNPRDGLGSANAFGFLAATLDGRVRVLDPTIPDETVSYLLQRNDGQSFEQIFPQTPLPGRSVQVGNNLRGLALASSNHESAFGEFPAHAIYSEDGNTPLLSWRVQLLPFLGYQGLYNQFNLDEPWFSPNNLALIPLMPEFFATPEVPNGQTVFQALTTPAGSVPQTLFTFENEGASFNEITDGFSNSIAFVEANSENAVFWTQPFDIMFDVNDPLAGVGAGTVPAGFFYARVDGSVGFFDQCVDAQTFGRAALINDGDTFTADTTGCHTGVIEPTIIFNRFVLVPADLELTIGGGGFGGGGSGDSGQIVHSSPDPRQRRSTETTINEQTSPERYLLRTTSNDDLTPSSEIELKSFESIADQLADLDNVFEFLAEGDSFLAVHI